MILRYNILQSLQNQKVRVVAQTSHEISEVSEAKKERQLEGVREGRHLVCVRKLISQVKEVQLQSKVSAAAEIWAHSSRQKSLGKHRLPFNTCLF